MALNGKKLTHDEVPGIVDHMRSTSHTSRHLRSNRNREAWRVVNGELDFSNKVPGQSTLVLPDLARGLEQVSARIERELTNSNVWFSIEDFDDVPALLITAEDFQKLVLYKLRHLWSPGYLVSGARTIEMVLSDSIKLGMVEGDITLKVAPITTRRTAVRAKPKPLTETGSVPSYATGLVDIEKFEVDSFALDIQAVPFEDAFPDPSGADAWFIHETTAKVSDLRANPDYNQEALDRLESKVASRDQEAAKQARDGQDTTQPSTPGTVRLRECWGDLIDKDGCVRAVNQLCTVAEGELLRAPTDNPLWWGSIPFVRGSLRRNPLGTVNPAFVDLAIDPYLAENDLYNLLLDDAKATVHGISQYRPDMLENESDLADGMPPGFRARLKRDAGSGKFYERLDERSSPPQHATAMLAKLGQSRETALATADLKIGQLPERDVLATEILSVEEGAATIFEAITGRLEDQVVEPALRLAIFSILQYLDDFNDPSVVKVLGPERAALLGQLSAEERFELLAYSCIVKVTGLREMTGRVKELRKLTTATSLVAQNPALAQVFDQEFSMRRMLGFMFRSLGVDTEAIKKRADEGPEIDPTLLNAQAGGGGNPEIEAAAQDANPGNIDGENGQF